MRKEIRGGFLGQVAAKLSTGGWGGVIQVNKGRRSVTGREYKMEKPAGQECTVVGGPERWKGRWEMGPDQAPSCGSCGGAAGRSYDVLSGD